MISARRRPPSSGACWTTCLRAASPASRSARSTRRTRPRILNKVAEQGGAVHHRQRRADSNRVLYIGTDNVAAGEQAGEQIKKALPNGGKIMLFVGTMDAANARERVEGIKKAIAGTKIEIIDIRTDGVDFAKAKAQRRGHAGQVPEHRRAGRPLVLQHAADLQGGAGRRQGRQGQDRRLRRGPGRRCAASPTGSCDRDRRAAAVRVRLPVDDGLLAKCIEGDKSVHPGQQARSSSRPGSSTSRTSRTSRRR